MATSGLFLPYVFRSVGMEADLAGAVTGIKALMEVPFLLAGGLFGTEVLSYPHDCCSRMHLCAGAFPVYATILSAAFSACLLYGAGADSVYPDVKWIGKRAVSIHIRAVCIPLSAAGAFCLCANIFGYVHVDGCDLCKPIGRDPHRNHWCYRILYLNIHCHIGWRCIYSAYLFAFGEKVLKNSTAQSSLRY